jgi:hypothetical protein
MCNYTTIAKETFREGLKKKLKLATIGMPRTTIVEIANSSKEIEKETPTPHKSPTTIG